MERPRADSGEKHGPGRSCGGYRLYWRSLCAQRVGQSVSIPVQAIGLARAASLDDRPQHARRSMEFCARSTNSAGTTVTRMGGDAGLPARAAPSRGQLCRAIGRDPTEGRGPPKTASFVSYTPDFCRICCLGVERAECAMNCREHAQQRVRSELDNSREGRTGTDAKLNRYQVCRRTR
jgi:hypothetical protein